MDAIKKGAQEGEKLAKDVTRKIAPEKGLAGTLKDTVKLGKEVKEQLKKDEEELIKKYKAEIEEAKKKM